MSLSNNGMVYPLKNCGFPLSNGSEPGWLGGTAMYGQIQMVYSAILKQGAPLRTASASERIGQQRWFGRLNPHK